MEFRCKLKSLNPFIMCKICKGYLIDATTITECLHTFCKTCLVKHLEDNNSCPVCNLVIHQSHPLNYISFDRTLQDIVYKIVPNLQQSELLREKEYYRLHSLPYPKDNLEKSIKDKSENKLYEAYYGNNNCNYHRDDEQVAVEFATHSEEQLKQIKPRYIRCSSHITINHLKKFIATQLYGNADKHREIDLVCNDETLGKDHTLKFIYVTRWRFISKGPLKIFYRPSYGWL